MVATQPPDGSGLLTISMARPPGASVICRVALPSLTLRMMAAQNASTSPSNEPVSARCAISRCMRAALLGDVGRQAEHVDIGLVADDDARRCIVEHEALRDIVHGGAQMTPFRGQRPVKPLMALQQQPDRTAPGRRQRRAARIRARSRSQSPCRRRCRRQARRRRVRATSASASAVGGTNLVGLPRPTRRAAIDRALVCRTCSCLPLILASLRKQVEVALGLAVSGGLKVQRQS